MPRFDFQAIDRANHHRVGALEASDYQSALAQLAREGLTITHMAAGKAGGTKSSLGQAAEKTSKGTSPKLSEVYTLLEEWSRCLQAGLTITDAVAISATGRKNTSSGRFAASVHEALQGGTALHVALRRERLNLPNSTMAVIEAGEISGQLSKALSRLSDRLAHDLRTRAELRSALMYPAFVVATAIGVVGIMFQSVIPTIEDIVGDKVGALPTSAQLILTASRFYRENFTVVWVAGGCFSLALAAALFHPALKPYRDRLLMRLPMIGPLLLSRDAAQFARSFSAQIEGGVGVRQATLVASGALSLTPLQAGGARLERAIGEGRAFSDAIKEELNQFPHELARFAAVGERTGRLAPMVEHAADLLEERTRRQIRTLTSLVTPTLTVALGALVGFVVFSLMSAIVGLNAIAVQ